MNSIWVMLLKWSALLALGWMSHGLLRRQHPGWRLFLWRGILCASLLVPVMQFAPIPVLDIPIYPPAISPGSVPDISPSTPASQPLPPNASTTSFLAPAAGIHPVASALSSAASHAISQKISWKTVLPSIWLFGVILAGFRLVRFQIQLGRLRRLSHPANSDLCQQLQAIQARLGVRKIIAVRVTNAISSPFTCGLWRPMILLPEKLVQELPAVEMSALLAHEIAHHRRHDLFWCIGWRWLQGIFWFHPLVWSIPSAHNLACEQEADRVASSQMHDRGVYPQLLARLTLRVLALPAMETQLALNGSSQIVQRLHHLKKGKVGGWRWKHSAAATALAAFLFLLTNGCNLSHQSGGNSPANIEFKNVLVVVQDEDGRPIQGASIQPDAFRVKGIHGADGYGWNTKLFGPAEKVTTDPDGKAWLKYPVESIPEEKEFTRSLIFSIYHPEFSTTRIQDYTVEGTNDPIQMTRGIPLEISAYCGADHQPVSDVIPNLNGEDVRPEDWRKMDNGAHAYHKLSPGGHLIQLMGKLPSGKIGFSDTLAFTAEKGKSCQFAVELKPGIRLEGRLDGQVSLPIKNGRVMIDVRPKEYPAMSVIDDFYDLDQTNGGRSFWHSYRPINEDGTFVFESIPPGEVDIFVLGDGFVSKSIGQLQNRYKDGLKANTGITIPQAFPLTSPITKIEVATEPTATLEFIATTKKGLPIEGVEAGLYPSVFRMKGPVGFLKESSEAPYREVSPLPDLVFEGKTDIDGTLLIKNIPAENRGFDVASTKYQVPLQDVKGWRDRWVRTTFSPGETNKLVMVMEPKGTDFIGTAK